ncbi:uncharacterized protein LOC127289035 isoform X2 [Leptopilina boulardi]|nr:uncharacterized protein LOC127289035 isoform X2 [Leptopilina boulardi]
MIQRLIADELRKHRDKERISIKRTYSDCDAVLHKNTNLKKGQPINLNAFIEEWKRIQASFNVDNSETTKKLKKSIQESATDPDKTVEDEEEEIVRNDKFNKAKEVEILRAETETSENVNSIRHEQKLDSHNAEIPVQDVKDVPPKNNELNEKLSDVQKDNSSQTQYCYLVRNTQSCHLEKKQLTSRIYFEFDRTPKNNKDLHKLPFFENFSNLNLSIQRRTSDNLIYEKHKGSASPSYVPSLERFPWKFLSPSNTTDNTL